MSRPCQVELSVTIPSETQTRNSKIVFFRAPSLVPVNAPFRRAEPLHPHALGIQQRQQHAISPRLCLQNVVHDLATWSRHALELHDLTREVPLRASLTSHQNPSHLILLLPEIHHESVARTRGAESVVADTRPRTSCPHQLPFARYRRESGAQSISIRWLADERARSTSPSSSQRAVVEHLVQSTRQKGVLTPQTLIGPHTAEPNDLWIRYAFRINRTYRVVDRSQKRLKIKREHENQHAPASSPDRFFLEVCDSNVNHRSEQSLSVSEFDAL